jgi:putative transposase
MIALPVLPSPPRQEQPSATPAPASGSVAWPISDTHVGRLQELLRIESAREQGPPRRRGRQASARQRLQQRVRQEAVACCRRLREQGQTFEECGALLHLAPRTLRAWDEESRAQTISRMPVGRPATRSPLPVRQAILEYVKLTGPGIGVPTLQEHFPGVARAELADLLERYRAVWRVRRHQSARVLHWQTPGLVWAADFTEPSCWGLSPTLPPIAACYPYVLAVRDLASGCMLAWQPLPALTEEVTREALARLFALHGAPLVLKMDNGSAFRAAAFQEFLEGSGVIPLYSPPSCPMYKGYASSCTSFVV